MTKRKFDIGKDNLSLLDIYKLAHSKEKIYLSKKSISRINKSREYLEKRVKKDKELIYGVNTGFGSLCNQKIDSNQIEKLQENLVISHDCGTGEHVPDLLVKIILLLKIRSLSFGYSGIRLKVIDRLMLFYNNNKLPIIYEQGSLGASGDLAPLAAVACLIISRYDNERIKRKPIKLSFKEGLALLNGTQFMSAYGLHCVVEARKLYHLSNLIASISLEAFSCRKESFDPLIADIRPHYGQKYTAEEILKILDRSKNFSSNNGYVQDPYSFRCIPQVHGASLDVIRHVESIFQIEIDSVTDNPLVFQNENKILSAGNFHGQSLAMAMDYLAISLAELGSISERRVFKLISGERNLPVYLTENPGVESGSMITQYTAASIVSQNKQYCTPASVDSIVSSNGQEDHVSMGANSATKLYKVLENLKTILAIELLNSSHAINLQKSCEGKSSPIINKFLKTYYKHEGIYNDSYWIFPGDDISCIRDFINEFDVLSFLKIRK